MTPKLKIEKNYTIIFDIFPDSLRRELINLFSFEVPNYWFAKRQMLKKASKLRGEGNNGGAEYLTSRAKNWDGTKKFIIDYQSHVRIPTGLVHDAVNFFHSKGINVIVESDTRTFLSYDPNNVSLNGLELRDYQQQAIQIMAERGCGVLLIGTGGGKTEVASGLIKKLNIPKTLFLTHRTLLESQSRGRLSKRLGMDIGLIEGDCFDPKQVTVGMVPTLYNRLKDNDRGIISYLKSVELCIGDEIHLGTSDSWTKVFKTLITCNVYGLSGTPWKRNIIDDTQLMSIIGPEIFRVPTRWLIDNGYLAAPTIKIVPFMHHDTDNFSYDEVIQYRVVHNQSRNDLIRRIVELDESNSKQTLVLTNIIEHGEILQEILKPYGSELIHSKMKRNKINATVEAFTNKHQNLLISTPLLDIGIDIPSLDKLILTGGGKAITTTLQRIGRSLRIAEGKVTSDIYDICDMNDKYLSEHSKERLLIYNDENQKFEMELLDLGNQLQQQEELFTK